MLQKVVRRPVSSAQKTFHLNEILSLASGLPLAREGQAAVHRLVAFLMENEATATNTQVNAETAKKCLEEQLPFLKEISMAGLYQIYNYAAESEEMENPYLDVWMEMQRLRYGPEHSLMPFSRWQQAKMGVAPAPAKITSA